jgi:hypothetical protein
MMRIPRALRHLGRALRDVHREQMLMWELWCQSSRVAVSEEGPLTWVASLDGHRLSGSHLPGSTRAGSST